jgi:hypothetical protein
MLDKCLNSISSNVSQLNKSDKEVFYSEVKHLVKIIQWNKEKYSREKEQQKQKCMYGFNMEIDAVNAEDSSDEELKSGPDLVVKKPDGSFHKL